MPDRNEDGLAAPRPVWRPTKPAADQDLIPTVGCGGEGPILSVDERWEMMNALAQEMDEAKEREQAEAEEKAKEKESRARGDEEDEARVVERFRNDRYAVKLLQQSDDVWGGGAGDTGVLG
ncbi:hypothetical protein [Actinoplanes palleronii]|uniref:Uncharacterized protein n=1 Tax=Actinoplanes palleronii TaxID=113570 RepID=A0ABQ4BFX5_9ACTN|nr:hypothetical protein [Actinoplanes palleronii]GIE69592.1 hypothetical protein Apa02nite_057000 [Actinoplanes palleronii]